MPQPSELFRSLPKPGAGDIDPRFQLVERGGDRLAMRFLASVKRLSEALDVQPGPIFDQE